MSIITKIEELCKQNSISIAELERCTSISRGSISRWDKSAPSGERVAKVAKYFNVTTDYLLGLTDKPYIMDTVDSDIISIQRARKKMTPKDKDIMMKMLKAGFDYAFNDDGNNKEGSNK